jgi:hypothetical protein
MWLMGWQSGAVRDTGEQREPQGKFVHSFQA